MWLFSWGPRLVNHTKRNAPVSLLAVVFLLLLAAPEGSGSLAPDLSHPAPFKLMS